MKSIEQITLIDVDAFVRTLSTRVADRYFVNRWLELLHSLRVDRGWRSARAKQQDPKTECKETYRHHGTSTLAAASFGRF